MFMIEHSLETIDIESALQSS